MAVYMKSRQKKLVLIATICAFLGVIISASRTVFILSAVGFVVFYPFAIRPGHRRLHLRVGKTALLVMLGFPVLLFSIYRFAGDVGLLMVFAVNFAVEQRIPWLFGEVGKIFSEGNYWGLGTGSMSQGLQYIPGGTDWYADQVIMRGGIWFESGISKLIFELGLLGLTFFYIFWGYMIYRSVKERKLIDPFYLKNIALSVVIFLTMVLVRFSFIHHQVLGDVVVLTIMWFFVGVLFSLKKLQSEKMRSITMAKT